MKISKVHDKISNWRHSEMASYIIAIFFVRKAGPLDFWDVPVHLCSLMCGFYSDLSVNMHKSKIRVVYEYEFRRGTAAAETTRRVCAGFGEASTISQTVGNWFRKFENGNFYLFSEPRGRPQSKVTFYMEKYSKTKWR